MQKAFSQVTLSVWNGSAVDTAWFHDNRNATEFYIWTAPQLNGLAKLINSYETFAGKIVHVQNPDHPDVPVVIDLDNKTWKEIGTGYQGREFQGQFYGHNCVIKNIVTAPTGWKSYLGFFGYISSTSEGPAGVRDVNLTGRIISHWGNIGGVVGYIKGTSTNRAYITNCTFNGEVTGSSTIGGIVGTLASYSDITDCAMAGTVTAFESTVGGIVGNTSGNSSTLNNITGCSNAAWVTAPEVVGGIVGTISNSNIKYCHNAGCVYGNATTTGGIIGYRADATRRNVQYCINTGTINMGGSINGGTTDKTGISYCYYDNQRSRIGGVRGTDYANYAIGTTHSHLIAPADDEMPDGLGGTASEWTNHFAFKAGHYPIPKNLATKNAAIIASVPIYLPESPVAYYNEPANFTLISGYAYTNDNPALISISGTSVLVNPTEGFALITVTNTGDGLRDDELWSKVFIIEKPYTTAPELTIANRSQLEAFRDAVNAGADGKYQNVSAYDGFKGITIKITGDINMGGISSWSPIGTYEHPFRGTFDGQCHLLKNLTVERASHNSGLFGVVNSAKIKNIKVTGNVHSTTLYVGGICARTKGASSDSTVFSNCHFYGTVSNTNYYIGGIIGYAGSYCVVENCSVGGNVTTTSYNCGGIIGMSGGALRIENCINIAEIKGLTQVGGIIGYSDNSSTKIYNCLNAGNVYGTSERTGGIASYIGSSKIDHCINTGTVSSGGSIVGKVNGNTSNFKYNYYDGQRSVRGGVNGADVTTNEGAIGKTTSELLALTDATFNDKWNYVSGSYPTPKNVGCDDPADAINNLVIVAAAPAIFDASDNYTNLQHNITLSANVTWGSNNLAIISNTGVLSGSVGAVIFTASKSGLEDITFKKKVLASVADVADPLPITSVEDLEAFRDAVNAGLDGSYKGNMNLDGYCGKRFILSADLSLATIPEWEPIGTSSNPFRGEFNGDGHTISDLTVRGIVNYSGLFGYVYSSCGGGIKNLVVEGDVSGTGYVGGICGCAVGLNTSIYCTIENCHFNGDVKATSSYSGGIVGYMGNYSKTKYCTTTGNVFSTSSYVGGIVGKTNGYTESNINNFCTYKRDSVLNCINNAIVTGNSHAGGICGHNTMSHIAYCLNAGEVKARANASSFGGIVGTNDIARGFVSQCLNVYNFNGFEGNIIGVDNDTVTSICPRTDADINYYDSLHCAIGVKNEANGRGKRTSELVGTLPSTFTSGKWWIKTGYYPMPINAEGSYPSNPYAIALNPTLVAGSPATLAIGGEGISTDDPDYVNTNQMTTRDFTIITTDGQTWTAPDDEILVVDGNNVLVNNPNYRRTYLTVTLGDYSKQMYFANSLYVPPIAIRDINDLKNLRDAVNRGSIGSFDACLYDEATGKPKKRVVNGVPTDEYVIEEAFNVNGYKGVNFYLVNNDNTYFEVDLTNSNWTPIGTSTYIFKGSFHGKGNKIKTLRTNTSYAGIFGYVEGSVIDNLNVQGYAYVNPTTGKISSDGATVYGSSYIGGLVGYAKKAAIRNCHVSAIVSGTGSYLGGICGKAVATEIENCDFSGKVIATVDYAGGICGYATDASSIISCTNAATVSGASYVGGIAGISDNGSVIRYCNNGGNISSTTEITGGICGNMDNASTIDHCLSTGGVNIGGAILGTKDDASTISDCFYDTQRCDREGGSGTTGKLTSQMLGNSLRVTLGTAHWAFPSNLYPVPKDLAEQVGATLAVIPLTLDERGNSSNHQTYREVSKNFDLVVPANASWKTNCEENEETTRTYLIIEDNVPTVDEDEYDCANIFVKYVDQYHVKSFFIQNPTHEDPILISSLKQFVKFREAVNAGEIGSYKGVVNENGFTGKNFKLTVPIDLAESADSSVKDDFKPIGTSRYPFKGNFDGADNTISNFTINGDGTNNNTPSSYRALFGYAVGSTIENLKVRCASNGISGSSYVAGICAYIRGVDGDNYANIRNCSFIGNISSTSSYVGGICGYAYYYTNIDTCEVAGTVSGGSSYTGGIVGYTGGSSDYRNYVRSCINIADVSGISVVGGICGNNATSDVMFCENGGNISGAVYTTGGISGNNGGNILYCISTANVSTGGAIAGTGANCRFCYYDRTRCSVNGVSNDRNISSDNDGVAMGLTPQQMTGTSPTGLSGLNWNATYWDFSEGNFPTPKNHSSNISTVAGLPIFINDPYEEQVWNSTYRDFTLGSSPVATWESDCDPSGTGHGYVTVVTPPSAAVDMLSVADGEIGSAILTATIGEAFKKYIVTSEMPPDSLSIASYADLVAFRNAVNAHGSGKYKGVLNRDGYAGITFYIVNDIVVDDTEGPWVTIAKDDNSTFVGNINGMDEDGVIHTVSNLNFENYDANTFYKGFIGRVYNGSIKNLIVSAGPGSYSAGTRANGSFGGICAYITGQSATSLGEIVNCKFYGDTITIVSSNVNTKAGGGICGYAGSWTKISNCSNYTNIIGSQYTGGIVGNFDNASGAYVNIENCSNEGNITAYNGKSYIGGICGRYYSTGTMYKCTNSGKITCGSYAGGIAAYQQGTSTYNATITSCTNYGEIIKSGNRDYIGGITGLSANYSTVTYCANAGKVTGRQYVGGISGQFNKTAVDKENIIKYCANCGEVTGTKWVGGICGQSVRTTISFSNNGGNVRGTTDYAGGIVGHNSTDAVAKNNISTGCVENNSGVGGIPNFGSGICGTNNGTLTNNLYDNLRCERKGVANADVAGSAEGYPTSALTGDSPSAMTTAIWADNFVRNSNMYPQPKGISGTATSILASTPVYHNESPVEKYDSVKNNFNVACSSVSPWEISWEIQEPTLLLSLGESCTSGLKEVEVLQRACKDSVRHLIVKTTDPSSGKTLEKVVKITLQKYDAPDLSLTSATPNADVCAGQQIELSTNTGYSSYTWGGGSNLLSTTGQTVTAVPSVNSTYKVTATDEHGCTSTSSVSITIGSLPSIESPTANDFVWAGGASEEWSNKLNWLQYNTSNGTYKTPSSAPNNASYNVYFEQYGSGCVDRWANENGNYTVKNIKMGADANLIVANGKTLTVKGNITTDGAVLSEENGKIVFSGSVAQTISGNGSMNLHNVQFYNTNGISSSLPDPIKIEGTATFTSGIVHSDVYFDKLANYTGTISSTMFVDGEVTKKMIENSTFTFPVGAMVGSGLAAKFKATTTNLTDLSVKYNTDNHDFAGMPDWWEHGGNMDGSSIHLNHVSDREYWLVSSTDATELSTVQLFWAASDNHSFDTNLADGPDDLAYLRLAYADEGGFVWSGLTTTYTGNLNAGSATATTETIPFSGTRATGKKIVTFASTKAQNLLLPIELLSFSAHCNGNTIDIDWTTASERNNDYFVLEKSLDAMNYTEYARVAGAGNSIEQIDYSYTDYDYYGGDVYYRLVQVDYDGTRTYSEIISAKCSNWEADPSISVFPNPFSSELTIVLENFRNEPASIEIYDVMGRTVKQMQVDSPRNDYETTFNLDDVPSGIYNVRVRTSGSTLNRQIVKE